MMYKTIKVCLREYKAIVKTKMFLATLVLAPILMSGGFIAGLVSEKNVDTNDITLAVIDRSGVLGEALLDAAATRNSTTIIDTETGKKIGPAYRIELIEPEDNDPLKQQLELSNRVRSNDLHAFVEIGADVVHPRNPQAGSINYYGQNASLDNVRGWLENPINNHIRQVRLKDAGIDVSEVQDLFVWQRVNGMGLVSVIEDTGEITDARRSNEIEAVVIPLVMSVFMYLMLMLVIQMLLMSVIEEKTQRIAEVLLGSVKPFEFMMGKLLGGIGVAFTALAVYLSGGFVLIIHLGYSSFVPFDILPWFFAYLLFAICMYGAIGIALGSLSSDMKDAQSLTFPVILPLLLALFLTISLIRNPSSTYAAWISMVPFFTPMIMLFRQAAPGGVPLWQPIVGMTGMILFTLFSVWIAGRVFRVGLLVQGKKPNLKKIIRWVIWE